MVDGIKGKYLLTIFNVIKVLLVPNSATKTRIPSFNFLNISDKNVKMEHKNHKHKTALSSKTRYSQHYAYYIVPNG